MKKIAVVVVILLIGLTLVTGTVFADEGNEGNVNVVEQQKQDEAVPSKEAADNSQKPENEPAKVPEEKSADDKSKEPVDNSQKSENEQKTEPKTAPSNESKATAQEIIGLIEQSKQEQAHEVYRNAIRNGIKFAPTDIAAMVEAINRKVLEKEEDKEENDEVVPYIAHEGSSYFKKTGDEYTVIGIGSHLNKGETICFGKYAGKGFRCKNFHIIFEKKNAPSTRNITINNNDTYTLDVSGTVRDIGRFIIIVED